MKIPDRLAHHPPELVLAVVIGAVLYALVLAWLVAAPEIPTGRVVSVDTDGHVTD